MEYHLLVLILALLVDRLAGDPDWLWRRVPHPVVLLGHAISFLDESWNLESDSAETRRTKGVAAILSLLVLSVLIGAFLSAVLGHLGLAGGVLEVLFVAVLLAQRSLADHVSAVASALKSEGISGGRRAVAMIVGRDPESLDEGGICRAAIESLAENFSDGVVAPALWFGLFGLPGLLAYKMLNTADSMIGHKSERHLDFGWAAARLDDAANWPAARISALLVSGAAFAKLGRKAALRALECAFRDAGLHRSPNAGWPECAMAGALHLSLAGERTYAGVVVREPRLNAIGRFAATSNDIHIAIGLFRAACTMLVLVATGLLIILSALS
jgi:adenosylcobinamide-phosphate synthase